MDRNKKLAKVYAPHKVENNEWKFGNAILKVNDVYQDYFNSSLINIQNIMIHQNWKYPNGQYEGNRGNNYKKIIKKIFNLTHTGKSLMRINPQNPNYIYWGDPNETVERLKLLMVSQHAGNNNQTNEIVFSSYRRTKRS